MKKRLLSLLLAVVMVVGMLPTMAFAADVPFAVTADGENAELSYVGDFADRQYGWASIPVYLAQVSESAKISVTYESGYRTFSSNYSTEAELVDMTKDTLQPYFKSAGDYGLTTQNSVAYVELRDSDFNSVYGVLIELVPASGDSTAAPFTAAVGGEAITEIVEGTHTMYGQNWTLYTITVPYGTETLTLTWDQEVVGYSTDAGNDDAWDLWDADPHTTIDVSVDGNGDGIMDYLQISEDLEWMDEEQTYFITFVEDMGDVYLSVSSDGQYVIPTGGTAMANVEVPMSELEKISLDDYGMGDYKYDADGDGNYEITALHLFIYAHEKLYGGKWSDVTASGNSGSLFFSGGLFGFTSNMTYYHNGAYAIDAKLTEEWGNTMDVGATADHIVLKAGDFVDVAGYSDWGFYSDPEAGFRYFLDENGNFTLSYTCLEGEQLTLALATSVQTWENWQWLTMEKKPGAGDTICYSQTLLDAEAKTVTADAEGKVAVTFDQLGTWYVWSLGDNISSPACAVVNVCEATYRVTLNAAENGTVTADKTTAAEGDTVTLTVTPAEGYELDTLTVMNGETEVSVTNNTFTMPAGDVTVTATFAVNWENPYTNVTAYWPNFRNGAENMAITDTRTPAAAATTMEKWVASFSSGWNTPSGMIIADDALIFMAGTSLKKVDLQTGEVLAETTMSAGAGFSTISPTYADGLIFCPQHGGKIEAFDVKTLKSVWTFTDELGGQNNTAITYADGYLYTGFWNGENKDANYVCVDAASGKLVWSKTVTGGFYWAGSTVVGDAVIVGTDDGTGGFEGDSHLYALNRLTGEVISDITLTGMGDMRSSVAYSAEKGRVYFTTKNGYLASAAVDAESGALSDLKANKVAAQATATPVVYGNKVFFGAGGGMQVGSTAGNYFVCDADTLASVYEVPLLGYPQGSTMVSTAYLEETGKLYCYTTYNNYPGGVTLIKIDPTKNDASGAELVELYDAAGHQQYCLKSPICGADGTIYYTNDSGYIFALCEDEVAVALRQEMNQQVKALRQELNQNVAWLNNAIAAGDAALKSSIADYAADVSKQIAAVNESIQAVNAYLAEIQSADDQIAEDVEALEESLKQAEETLDAAIAQVQTNLDNAVAELKKTLETNKDEASAQIDGIRQALEVLESNQQLMQQNLEGVQDALEAAIAEALEGYKASDAALEVKIQALQGELNNAQAELNAAKNEAAQIWTFVIVITCIFGATTAATIAFTVWMILKKKH